MQFVVVGNNNVGKSSLCVTFSTGQFPSLFTPMECNRVPHEKEVTVGGSTVHVKCVDTEGHVRFPFSYGPGQSLSSGFPTSEFQPVSSTTETI